MLAKPWKATDPTGMWWSEKWDGLRAYWDGQDFWSREGNRFHAPAWFKKGLPRTPLDGELHAGRGGFQVASGIVRSQGLSDAWKRITFDVFDSPAAPGGFEDRVASIPKLVKGAPFARAIKHRKAKSAAEIKRELARVEKLGGEGLVLRAPGSSYEGRRTSTFLKVKSTHDAEAVITGYYPGKGKHAGVIGGFHVETLADKNGKVRAGIRFKLGTGLSDAERRSPPKIGATITYKFQGTSDGGTPRFASFLRVRKNPRKSSRKRQRQLEREMFGPGPREPRERRGPRGSSPGPSDAHRYGPPGIPGNCWACGNVCDPVREWQCPACKVVYPPATEKNPFPFPQQGDGLDSTHCVVYVGWDGENDLPPKIQHCADYNGCWTWIHQAQGQSVDWAMKHGGYSIQPAPWSI